MKQWDEYGEINVFDQDIVPATLQPLLEELNGLSSRMRNALFRGQANKEWRLISSLDRHWPSGMKYMQMLEEEYVLISRFEKQTQNLWGENEKCFIENRNAYDRVARMVIMQHYGAPTRLIDWTKSVFIAAFFATISEFDQDSAIWWLDLDEFNRSASLIRNNLQMAQQDRSAFDYNQHIFRLESPSMVGLVGLTRLFHRAEVQQAAFTIGGRLGEPHDFLIAQLIPRHCGRVIIKAELKQELLDVLSKMNITAASLNYNGADSYGFRMSWERQVACRQSTA